MTTKKPILAVAFIIALSLLIFVLKSCGDGSAPTGPESTATSPTPSAKASAKPRTQSSDYIAGRIKARLDSKSDITTRIECPARVVFTPKSSFKCDVFDDDDPEDIPLNEVVVVFGDNDNFTWKTVNQRTPTEAGVLWSARSWWAIPGLNR